MSAEYRSSFEGSDPLQDELRFILDSTTPALQEEQGFTALVLNEVRQTVWQTAGDLEMWPRFSKGFQGHAIAQWRRQDRHYAPAITVPFQPPKEGRYKEHLYYALRQVGRAYSYYLCSPDEASLDVHQQKIRAEYSVTKAPLREQHRTQLLGMLEDYVPIHPSVAESSQEVVLSSLGQRLDEPATPKPWPHLDPIGILQDIRSARMPHPITAETIVSMVWADRYIGKAALSGCPDAIALQASQFCKMRDEQLLDIGLIPESTDFVMVQSIIDQHLGAS